MPVQKMDWDRLLSTLRLGQEHLRDVRRHARTEFQRDYDRLIFSSPFRRLQNKTQVFPLPGSVFVHNRLTHSLEVSCVGRSIANNVATELMTKYADQEWVVKLQSLDDVVAAACLAHDLGNPPFGHSGERAIATYFSEGNGKQYRELINPWEWSDVTHFEGNANALRLLSHRFNGRRAGGFALTYTTLASIIKYPYASTAAGAKAKFGYFESEDAAFHAIMDELSILPADATLKRYCRHPLVFLVEAADDICYQIMDIEDAHRLKLLSTAETFDLLLAFFEGDRLASIKRALDYVEDPNEQVSYLRSCAIGTLVYECSKAFVANEEAILEGTFTASLISQVDTTAATAYARCSKLAYEKLYCSPDVVDIEVAGHQIISVLLDKMLDAVIYPEKSYSKLLLDRIPKQYETHSEMIYTRILAILDYISGMTDIYALDLYRKITGMSLPSL